MGSRNYFGSMDHGPIPKKSMEKKHALYVLWKKRHRSSIFIDLVCVTLSLSRLPVLSLLQGALDLQNPIGPWTCGLNRWSIGPISGLPLTS